jgi:hypothetical protein
MNDGDEVIARLPNPIAGPSYFTIASEISTRRFISLTMDPVPMPRLRDWDFRHKNEVGAGWILEDKAAGLPLRQFWFTMDRETQFYIVRQVVEIEKRLGAIKFPHHGSLYQTLYLKRWLAGTNVPSSSLQSLYELNNIPTHRADEGYDTRYSWFLNFSMGPSVDRTIYHRRKIMKEHHGPCMYITFDFMFPFEFLTNISWKLSLCLTMLGA